MKAPRYFSGADAQCPACLQLHSLELLRSCARCDGAVCAFCVTEHDAELVCAGCKEVANGGARHVES